MSKVLRKLSRLSPEYKSALEQHKKQIFEFPDTVSWAIYIVELGQGELNEMAYDEAKLQLKK